MFYRLFLIMSLLTLTGCALFSSRKDTWQTPFENAGYQVFQEQQRHGLGTIVDCDGAVIVPARKLFSEGELPMQSGNVLVGNATMVCEVLSEMSFRAWAKKNPERIKALPKDGFIVLEALKFYNGAPYVAYKAVSVKLLLEP